MHPVILLALTVVAAYLVGAVPFGYLVARWRGVDIFRHGSGNIGATNVGRVLGRRFGLLVFALDFLKGAVPVAVAQALTPASLDLPAQSLGVAAGIAAFVGHLLPIYLRFRGGKGVATGAGAVLMLTPLPAAFAILAWGTTLAVTRYVSVSSVLAAVLLCAMHILIAPSPWDASIVVTSFCFVVAVLVTVRHVSNIRRLLRGTENRLQETPAMLLLGKTLHVLAVGLWFGTVLFFVIVGFTLFSQFGALATREASERPNWLPLPREYAGPSPSKEFPDPLRKEQGTRVAGYAVAPMFGWFFGIQEVCGLIAAATALAWTATNPGRVHRMRAYILLTALISVVAGHWLERRVEQATRARNDRTDEVLLAQEPSAEMISQADAARSEFSRLHGYSMMLNLVTILLVTGAMALTAQLPTEAGRSIEHSLNGHVLAETHTAVGTGTSSNVITTGYSMDQPLDHLPRLPRRKDFGIGCLGAGFIMRDCHLVAYRQAGFNPVAIASRHPESARAAAERHAIPRVHERIDDLFTDPAVEVLDIAVPPDAQPEMIRRAVASRKNLRAILAQKPLALTIREGRECVELCAKAGILLGVNQNMRYDQSVRAMKDLLNRGWLGELVLATIEMRAIPHWMPWSEALPSLSTYIMSVHHLDTFRYWFGTPDRVLASTRPDPRTRFPHRDGINLYILEYDGGLRASSWDDVWAGPAREGGAADIGIRWRIEGTEGMARGTIGWPDYPARVPSTLDYTTTRRLGEWIQPRWSEVWFPDAFVGTMAQLLCALEDGTEPEIGGRDNLETLALCEAVFTAATQHRVTTVREFLA